MGSRARIKLPYGWQKPMVDPVLHGESLFVRDDMLNAPQLTTADLKFGGYLKKLETKPRKLKN